MLCYDHLCTILSVIKENLHLQLLFVKQYGMVCEDSETIFGRLYVRLIPYFSPIIKPSQAIEELSGRY